jgi:hypothetical protein
MAKCGGRLGTNQSLRRVHGFGHRTAGLALGHSYALSAEPKFQILFRGMNGLCLRVGFVASPAAWFDFDVVHGGVLFKGDSPGLRRAVWQSCVLFGWSSRSASW